MGEEEWVVSGKRIAVVILVKGKVFIFKSGNIL